MSIFAQDEITLNELQSHLEVIDNMQEGEIVEGVLTTCNGTFPLEGHEVDKNGQPYTWHNFLVCLGETYDSLKEEYGENTPIPWETLYAAGITSSQFERDLEAEMPRAAKAEVTVQRSGDEINILTSSLRVTTAESKARFHDQKDSGKAINTTSDDEETVTA